MAQQRSTRALASILVAEPGPVDLSREQQAEDSVGKAASGAKVASVATSISRICSGRLAAMHGEVEVHGKHHFKRRYLSERTSRCKPISVSWTLQKELIKIYTSPR